MRFVYACACVRRSEVNVVSLSLSTFFFETGPLSEAGDCYFSYTRGQGVLGICLPLQHRGSRPETSCPTSYVCVWNITQFIRHGQQTLAPSILTSTQHSSCKRCLRPQHLNAWKALLSDNNSLLTLFRIY